MEEPSPFRKRRPEVGNILMQEEQQSLWSREVFQGKYPDSTGCFVGVLCLHAQLQPRQPTMQGVFCPLVPTFTLLRAACQAQ